MATDYVETHTNPGRSFQMTAASGLRVRLDRHGPRGMVTTIDLPNYFLSDREAEALMRGLAAMLEFEIAPRPPASPWTPVPPYGPDGVVQDGDVVRTHLIRQPRDD